MTFEMDSSDHAGGGEPSLYVSASEAAAMMGVAVSSLYAYVGRKGIRSQSVPGSRKRLYWREDVEKIADRKSPQRVISWDSVLVPETKITLITEKGPYYRGHSAVALAETATLEDVAALLWEQPKGTVFPDVAPPVPHGFAAARKGLANLSPREQAGSLFSLLESSNPRNFDRTALGFARAGGELLRWFVALTTGEAGPSIDPVHVALARGWKAPPGYDDVLRRLLVLLADHELTADTYAVRAVANTGCTPHQAVIAGMVATNGRRVKQGRASSVRRLIDEIISDTDPGRPLVSRYRSGEPIPGFEDNVYHGPDARAVSLLRTLAERMSDDVEVQRLLAAVDVARNGIGVEPGVAVVSIFLERKFQVPPRDASFKIAARMVGWIAHAFEQMESGPLVRPRTAYTGILPRDQ